MDIVELFNTRYTTKVFDKTKIIPQEKIEKIEEILRKSPSSTNAQPWHFFIASDEQGKARIAKAATGRYVFNAAKITEASHVVVLCARAAIDETYLRQVLQAEAADGRFANEELKKGQHDGRTYFVNMHRFERRDAQHWMEKQVYLALGALLVGAAALGIDSCTMEGFDQAALDAELGLREKGLISSVVVSLGYRAAEDINAKLPKSRLPLADVVTKI